MDQAEQTHLGVKKERGDTRADASCCRVKARAFEDARTIKWLTARVEELEAYQNRGNLLERSERRLKKQLRDVREELRDKKSELGGVTSEFLDAQSKVEEQTYHMDGLRKQVDRYRGWWLNEYLFVKILLDLVPCPKDVEEIASCSHDRYRTYCDERTN
ncbi:hypothetical protein DFP72DRAFT_856053 [Ephemerocybe angulata]|uniref:Uncharacterized protein n=1 Tax=Ephemerocybe angulata TaxID=980116 RepID=A0A8H6HGB8_9AGAR|nr:hypothetical protein DFP72DRAFT_856053 [Tulosesus angulatus]